MVSMMAPKSSKLGTKSRTPTDPELLKRNVFVNVFPSALFCLRLCLRRRHRVTRGQEDDPTTNLAEERGEGLWQRRNVGEVDRRKEVERRGENVLGRGLSSEQDELDAGSGLGQTPRNLEAKTARDARDDRKLSFLCHDLCCVLCAVCCENERMILLRSFILQFIHSAIHSFCNSFIHSFVHSFIHSFISKESGTR